LRNWGISVERFKGI